MDFLSEQLDEPVILIITKEEGQTWINIIAAKEDCEFGMMLIEDRCQGIYYIETDGTMHPCWSTVERLGDAILTDEDDKQEMYHGQYHITIRIKSTYKHISKLIIDKTENVAK